jgi:membrane-associated protease RseP (regulator of RpoE activity)
MLMRVKMFLLAFLFSTSFLIAQDRPKGELFGGYSYLHGFSSGSTGINGAEGSASWNFNDRVAADFDISWYHESAGVASGNSYFYLAGPRLNFGHLFVHGLVGGAHSNAGAFGISASENSLGAALGGGFQWKIVKNISFRTGADYVLTNYGSSIQNSARVSVGLVFGFGGSSHPRSIPQSSPMAPGNQSAPLLGVTGHPGEGGFDIVSVEQGSIASHIGLAPGDVILKINGTPVSSGLDIEKVMGESNSRGTLDYLIQGNWAAQKSF